MEKLKFQSDLGLLAETFHIHRSSNCEHLNQWISATYTFNNTEKDVFESLFADVVEDVNYWNEEELKIQFIGTVFRLANINVKSKIKVFFERSLSAKVDNHLLAVIADCLVATPLAFSTPQHPYFFLQEYKKGRGESKDPEAQMLMAMLIAQEKNGDGKPIYGSYLFGSHVRFTTLVDRDYCVSKNFSADERSDLLQIVFILRHLKELILNR
ncbi:MAG: hypothetical protein LH609_09370 [Rudanella sp.]|nr:hypothetical protein [Rudanella sp.]